MIILNTITGTLGTLARFCRRPVGCPLPSGTVDYNEYCTNWIRNNRTKSKFVQTSWGTYIGLFNVVLGAILGLAGKLKEKPYLKWLGWGLACIGLGVAAIGKLYGFEFDITNGVVARKISKTQKRPEDVGIKEYEVTSIKLKDDKRLHGYFIRAKNPTKKTLIYIHGIRNDVGDCLDNIKQFQDHNLNANILVVDPRGFGNYSDHVKVTSDTLVEDAIATYDYLINERNIKPEDISVFGHSLGGAVAVQLAKERKIHSLILQSTFDSFNEAVNKQLSRYLNGTLASIASGILKKTSRINFDSKERIKDVQADKILILYGTGDKIIICNDDYNPANNLKEEALKSNKNCEAIKLEGAGHGNYTEFYESHGIYSKLKEYIEDDVVIEFPKDQEQKVA